MRTKLSGGGTILTDYSPYKLVYASRTCTKELSLFRVVDLSCSYSRVAAELAISNILLMTAVERALILMASKGLTSFEFGPVQCDEVVVSVFVDRCWEY
jgi:hypothetical protein